MLLGIDEFEIITLVEPYKETIREMSFSQASRFIKHLYREQNENRLILRWMIGYQTSMSFEDFKRELTPKKPMRDDKEILEEVYRKFKEVGIE